MTTAQRPIGLWIDLHDSPPVAEQIGLAVIPRLENDMNGAFFFHFRNLESGFQALGFAQSDRFCAGSGFGVGVPSEFYLVAVRIG